MASSLVPALAVAAPASIAEAVPVTDGEHGGLLQALAAVPDPRDPRGVRHPLTALLAVAVCAVMAGATSFAASTVTDMVVEPRHTSPGARIARTTPARG
ncbi:transposase family protein [Micromonospora sp. DT31]|uniref:transposase family protein n=1 Tax=Micromonospora sp. DT31 TaxID=3393434 RepID=UPI003CF9D1F9